MLDVLRQLEKMGLIPVSHDEMVAFLDGYPWTVEQRINKSKQMSYAFWEKPDKGKRAVLIAIKKFSKPKADFQDRGYCFIIKDPDYRDVQGREWRKIDGKLCCVLAVANRRTETGETFTEDELIAVAASDTKNLVYDERSRKLYAIVWTKKPPVLVRTKEGVDVKEV